MTSSSLPQPSASAPQADPPAPARAPRDEPGLAIVVALAQTLGTAYLSHAQSARLSWVAYALLAGGGLLLSSRRKNPAGTLLLVGGTTLAYHLLGYPSQFTTYLALICAALAAFVETVRFISRTVREQERLHSERQKRRASEERLRIAQELHDVLGHHLSLINVRAGVGLHLMDRQPDQARLALDTIKLASSEALREVRSVLDAIYPAGEAAPRAPAPGLDRLGELTGGAGLPVRTEVRGEARPVPAEVDRAAYRIVQEALTNVRRHAGPGVTAAVVVDYGVPGRVAVQIEDDGGVTGPQDAPAAEGIGLSGMRERAVAVGGTLAAGPIPTGGWRVLAELPVPEHDAAELEAAALGTAESRAEAPSEPEDAR
jgi:signal transduction histidine kinase